MQIVPIHAATSPGLSPGSIAHADSLPTVSDILAANANTTPTATYTIPTVTYTTPVETYTTPVETYTTPVETHTIPVETYTTPEMTCTTPTDACTTAMASYTTPTACYRNRYSSVDWLSGSRYRLFTMKTPENPSAATGTAPARASDAMALALGHPLRWRILAELSDGAPLMVVELARRLGRSPALISKHLRVLRQAGMVVIGQAGLYRIPPQYLPSPGQRVVDYGPCLLRCAATS